MSHWKAALRSLAHRPAFAATTVAVLAFGLGATSALYSILDTVLLRPLPYPRPDRVVSVMGANPSRNERSSLISPAQLEDWNRLASSFASISGS